MNRYEANRLAKRIFLNFGWSAVDDFEDIQALNEWTDEEADLVFDYYKRCANRVSDWLRL